MELTCDINKYHLLFSFNSSQLICVGLCVSVSLFHTRCRSLMCEEILVSCFKELKSANIIVWHALSLLVCICLISWRLKSIRNMVVNVKARTIAAYGSDTKCVSFVLCRYHRYSSTRAYTQIQMCLCFQSGEKSQK